MPPAQMSVQILSTLFLIAPVTIRVFLHFHMYARFAVFGRTILRFASIPFCLPG